MNLIPEILKESLCKAFKLSFRFNERFRGAFKDCPLCSLGSVGENISQLSGRMEKNHPMRGKGSYSILTEKNVSNAEEFVQ